MSELLPDEIQAYVKTRIESHPSLAGTPWQLGGGVIIDDGLYPKTPGFEACIKTYGVAIVAWRIGSIGLIDISNMGVANELLHVPVLIQENEKVNRGGGENALGITAERLMQYVKQAVSGFPKIRGGTSITFTPILLHHDPFQDFGVLNGMRTILVNFSKQNRITPLST